MAWRNSWEGPDSGCPLASRKMEHRAIAASSFYGTVVGTDEGPLQPAISYPEMLGCQLPVDQNGNALASYEDENTASVLPDRIEGIAVCTQSAKCNFDNQPFQFADPPPLVILFRSFGQATRPRNSSGLLSIKGSSVKDLPCYYRRSVSSVRSTNRSIAPSNSFGRSQKISAISQYPLGEDWASSRILWRVCLRTNS